MANELLPKNDVEILPAAPAHLPLATPARVVEAFLAERNQNTLRVYRQGLAAFQAFLNKPSLEEACAFFLSRSQGEANDLVLAYRAHLRQKKLSVATQNHRLAALRSLVKLARMLGVCSFSIEVKSLRVEAYRDTRGPGAEGIDAMLAALERGQIPKERRDYALLRLLYDLALRRGEVLGLDLEHIDLSRGTVRDPGEGANGAGAAHPPRADAGCAARLGEGAGDVSRPAVRQLPRRLAGRDAAIGHRPLLHHPEARPGARPQGAPARGAPRGDHPGARPHRRRRARGAALLSPSRPVDLGPLRRRPPRPGRGRCQARRPKHEEEQGDLDLE